MLWTYIFLMTLFPEIPCKGGQVFQNCPNECVRTCHIISNNPVCTQDLTRCAEGCSCPEGQTLNDHGDCIPVSQCPCEFGTLQYAPGVQTKMENKIW